MAFAYYAPLKSLYNAYQNAPQHTGSWGTKDFGITEAVGGWFNQPTSNQGGSQIFGGAPQQAYQQPTQQNYSSQVASTQPTTTPTTTSYTGTTTPTGGSTNPQQTNPDSSGQTNISNALDSSYNTLFADLDNQLNTLLSTKGSQEQQVGRTYDTSVSNLKSERDFATNQIETTKQRSLNDISDSLRNMWQQGSRVLGARGASDSSAVGQYNYAITKLGSRQRYDLNTHYADRLGTLQQLYAKNISQLENDKLNQLQSINDWYRQAQGQIATTRAGLQAQKSQSLLDYALKQLEAVKSEAQTKQNALQTWAINKATTYEQAAQALGLTGSNLKSFSGSLNQGGQMGSTTNQNQFGFGNFSNNENDYLKQLMGQ